MRQTQFMIFALSLSLITCGGEQQTAAPKPGDVESQVAEGRQKIEAAKAEHPSEIKLDPCKILTADLLQAHFEVGEDLNLRSHQDSPNPLCSAEWEKPNAEELRSGFQKQMSDYLTAKAQGKDVKMPRMRLENEVSLTLSGRNFESSAQAAESFRSAMKKLNEGISGGSGKSKFTFQADTTPVPDVGDQAEWSPKMHQISVQSGRHIFHVTVKTHEDPADDLPKAKELASAIATELPTR